MLIAINSQGQSTRSNPAAEGSDRIIKLYPNPATSYITFDLQKGYQKGLSIQVFSLIGKKSFEGQNIPQKVNIDLAEFNRGVYFYYLIDLSGKVIESGKFQVSK
jgi:hypothetical protein